MTRRIIDAHCDTLLRVLDDGADLRERSNIGHIDLPRLKEAGVQLQFFALYSSPRHGAALGMERILSLLDAFYGQMEQTSDLFLVRTREDVGRTAAGRVGGLIVLEGGDFITNLAQLRSLFRLGVRSVMLTWNGRNLLADGAGQPPHLGISALGKDVLHEMQRLGMLLDVSHLNEQGFWDLLETTTGPLVASHSNARALCDHVRNLTDAQLDALGERQGVAGLNFCPPFLSSDGRARLDDIIRHYEYIAGRIGPQSVALGTDYDGIDSAPLDLPDTASLARLADVFAGRYSERDVSAFLYDNMARVLTAVLPSEEV